MQEQPDDHCKFYLQMKIKVKECKNRNDVRRWHVLKPINYIKKNIFFFQDTTSVNKRNAHAHVDLHSEICTDRHSEMWTDRLQRYGLTNIQRYRQTDIQRYGQAGDNKRNLSDLEQADKGDGVQFSQRRYTMANIEIYNSHILTFSAGSQELNYVKIWICFWICFLTRIICICSNWTPFQDQILQCNCF